MQAKSKASIARTSRLWKQVPEILYKYYPPERLEVFGNFRVRFSQLTALNDPFEFLIDIKPGVLREGALRVARSVVHPIAMMGMAVQQTLKILRERESLGEAPALARIIVGTIMLPLAPLLVLLAYPFVGKHIKALMIAAADEFEEIVGKARNGLILVFSCSETWDSVPMWAHYAATHRGFTIGINPRHSFFRPNKEGGSDPLPPRKVAYQDKMPSLKKGSMEIGDFIAAKMSHWSYEREWRFTELAEDADEVISTASGPDIFLFDLNPSSIVEITFGAQCDPLVIDRVMQSVRGYGVEPAFYSIQRGLGYGFERRPITSADQALTDQSDTSAMPPTIRGMHFERMEKAFLNMTKEAQNHWLLGPLNRASGKGRTKPGDDQVGS